MTWGNGLGWCIPNTGEMVGNIVKAGETPGKKAATKPAKKIKLFYKNGMSWRVRKRNRGHELLKNI